MKLKSSNINPWKISRSSERDFSVQRVQRALAFCNKVSKLNFYVIDHQEQKFIVGDSHNATVLGYPKECIRKEKFDFLKRVVSEKDRKWFLQMRQEALQIFYQYDNWDTRMELEITCDFIVTSDNCQKMVLHSRMVPCDLDDNGNLWRSMLHVWTSPFVCEERKAGIVNFATGDTYDFENEKFELASAKILTTEEAQILEFLANDFSAKDICEQMNLSATQFDRKKQSAFKKLGVNSQTAAACMAVALGYIQL